MADGPASDAAVIAASLANPETFGVIYDRHFSAVFGYLGRAVRRDTALDLAAEVFVRAFGSRSRFRSEYGSARPWLMGIAANLLAGHFRGRARERRAFSRAVGHIDQLQHSLENEAISRLHAEAHREAIAAAMATLRTEERSVVSLFALGGLSYAEIALALGIPEGTVRSRLSRARRKLASLLKDAQPTGSGHEQS
ncbi:MAG: RNA polymerase sigma factor [Acidimicrobiia bacterium]